MRVIEIEINQNAFEKYHSAVLDEMEKTGKMEVLSMEWSRRAPIEAVAHGFTWHSPLTSETRFTKPSM